MYPLPSSTDLSPAATATEGAVSENRMRKMLGQFFAEELRPSFLERLMIGLADPFQKSKSGGFRLGPLWVGLGLFAALAVSIFLYFNLGRL